MDLVGTERISRVYGKDKAIIGEILSKLGGSAMYRYRDRIGSWHWFESSDESIIHPQVNKGWLW